MIELIKRENLFKYKNLSDYLYKSQKSFYEDLMEDSTSQEISETALYLNKVCDFLTKDNLHVEETHINEIILGTCINKLSDFSINFPEMFIGLFDKSNHNEFIFLLEIKSSWKKKDSEYELLSNTLKQFNFLLPNITENDAIIVSKEHLSKFLNINFWLSRCSGSLPRIIFTTHQDKFVGHICKYGNLHLYSNNFISIDVIKLNALNSSFIELREEDEIDKFN